MLDKGLDNTEQLRQNGRGRRNLPDSLHLKLRPALEFAQHKARSRGETPELQVHNQG